LGKWRYLKKRALTLTQKNINEMATAFYPGTNAAQEYGLDGKPFSSVATTDAYGGFLSLQEYFNRAHNQQEVTNRGQGTYRSYQVKDDMPGITDTLRVIYVGLVSGKLHWLNGEKGLPAILSNNIYHISGIVRWENFTPTQTPAMGVPRFGRKVAKEIVSKSENYSMMFYMEDEQFSSKDGQATLSANMFFIAGQMSQFMAREAYRALHFAQTMRPINYASLGNDEESLVMAILAERDLFAMPHKHENGLYMLSEHCATRLVTGPSHVRPTVAVFPMGKISAMMGRNPLYTEYYRAGANGPKRLRDGMESNLETGEVTENKIGFTLVNGIQVLEGPFIEDNDSKIQEFHRSTYTGEFFHFTVPQDGFTGHPVNGVKPLPWIRVFSARDDQFNPILFEQAFRNCGRFELVPGVADDNASHGTDANTHLWTLNESNYRGGNETMYPKDTTSADADPFVYYEGGRLKFRKWCDSPARPEYIDDLPTFYDTKLNYSNEDLLALADYETKVAVKFDPTAFAAASTSVSTWDPKYAEMKMTIFKNSRKIKWNIHIAKNGATGATEANVGKDAFDAQAAATVDLNTFKMNGVRLILEANGGPKGRTMREWSELVDHLLFRGAVGTRMQDVPFYKDGQVGNTFHGNMRFNMAQNVGNNSWAVRADCRIGIHIYDENSICVARNAIYHGIISGSDSRIMTVDQAVQLKNNNFAMDSNHPSIHSICIPKNDVRWRTSSGLSYSFDNDRVVIATAGTFPIASSGNGESLPHYPGHKFYNELYGFSELSVHGFSTQLNLPFSPALLRGGVQYPTSAGFREEKSQGHHGPEASGVRETRMTGRRLNPILI
jgi:hypothetical protein